MSQRMVRLVRFATWGVLSISCNRRPQPPPAPPAGGSPQAQAEPARPTTQELLSGSYKRLVLPGMPLAVQAPQSWKIEMDGPLTFLQGPTPTDVLVDLTTTDRTPGGTEKHQFRGSWRMVFRVQQLRWLLDHATIEQVS